VSAFAVGPARYRPDMPMTTAEYRRAWRRGSQPVAATLEQCAELLGVDLAQVEVAAVGLEPYEHADGSPRWSVRELAITLGLERRRTRSATGAKLRVDA
jgi:hypothetical protein